MASDKGKKKLLGEYLLERGLVTQEQVQKALEEQRKAGARLGQTLIELGFLAEDDLIVALARQLGLAHIDITSYGLKPAIVKLIPESLARRYEVLALEKVGNDLTIAMADPLNVFAIDEIQKITKCRIEPVICSRTALFKVLDKCYKDGLSEPKPEAAPPPADAYAKTQQSDSRETTPLDGKEVIELVDTIVRKSVEERATDIHIEPDEEEIRVRCRVDGFLRELMTFSKDVQLALVSRIKVLSGLDISEKRVPQDGRFQFEINDRKIDLRVSTLPTVLGEKVVMRLLDKSTVVMNLDNLGFLEQDLKNFKELIHRPYGMILVTGPTSSGKTTTLYSALTTINTIEKNILTVEDPVEYRMKMINQVQVNPRAGLTFAAGLRSFLRQDPNVIMIGEIRDLETAEIAIQSSLTGHLV
ncbi:MAG: ATPase, T2SS/T4P/T4SS family, partial [Candidatus Omnitrophica bacterium]|nr:ATPase, T2SS/T4P/T4SS family [Candidatus Omnitrophota bacterium]